MDPGMVDVGRLDNEARRRVLEYVLSRGVRPRDLGFDSTYVYKARTGG
jgi:hypothetical protein